MARFFFKMKKVSICLVLFLVCGCLPVTSKSLENYFKDDTCYNYHYQHLSKKQKKLYQKIYNIAYSQEKDVQINQKDIDKVTPIIEKVLKDHPEFFYIEEWTLTNKGIFNFKYTFTKKEIKKYQQLLNIIVHQIKEDTKELDTYEKIKYIYEYLIQQCQYQKEAKYNQEMVSALIYHQTVCSGYAKALQYLLHEVGIEATYLTGKSVDSEGNNESHAWNMVQYDNDYYYIDATWGDLVNSEFETVNYDYLMFSSEEMNKIYQTEDPYENTINDENTYYKKEGYYFDHYRIEELKQKIDFQKNECHFQFSNQIYEWAKIRLVRLKDAYKILNISKDREIKYIDDERFHTIYLRW